MENCSNVIVDYTGAKVFIIIQLVYLREVQCLLFLNTIPYEFILLKRNKKSISLFCCSYSQWKARLNSIIEINKNYVSWLST